MAVAAMAAVATAVMEATGEVDMGVVAMEAVAIMETTIIMEVVGVTAEVTGTTTLHLHLSQPPR